MEYDLIVCGLSTTVSAAAIADDRKDRICKVLELRAAGVGYSGITAATGISRGAISNYLHEAEKIAGCVFTEDKRCGGMGSKIASITRTARAVGSHSASKYDFH